MSLSLTYVIKEPTIKKDKNPLLLLLHGYGSNEEDLFSFKEELPSDYYIVSARAPYDLQPYGHAWYAINFDADMNKFSDDAQAIQSRDTIAKFIVELVEQYPIDASNVTLIGFSQGCILSYAVALTYPEKVKRVVALSGYLNENIIGNTQGIDYTRLNFFISHGTVDQVVPVEWARKAPEFLNHLGIKNTYQEYMIGHGVAPKNFFDFRNWLLNS